MIVVENEGYKIYVKNKTWKHS